MNKKKIAIGLISLVFSSCASKPTMKVNKESIDPGTRISIQGKDSKLSKGSLSLGDHFPSKIAKTDIGFVFNDKVTIINIVPSIDTKVCEEQTHLLGESIFDSRIELVSISRDLPMAQARFAEEAKLKNIKYYSDYRSASFGNTTGLLMLENALLARGVIVLDQKGIVKYMQIVPEVSELPDMPRAFAIAKALL